jgi:DNA-binding transcriptional MerR regulator
MRIGELARRAGVSAKAVRYYESMGVVASARLANGYRDYDEGQVPLVREIRELALLGIRVDQARPFLDCLVAGNGHGDDCADSIAAYRSAIAEIDGRMTELRSRRDSLAALLVDAESRRESSSSASAEPLCAFSADRLASADID